MKMHCAYRVALQFKRQKRCTTANLKNHTMVSASNSKEWDSAPPQRCCHLLQGPKSYNPRFQICFEVLSGYLASPQRCCRRLQGRARDGGGRCGGGCPWAARVATPGVPSAPDPPRQQSRLHPDCMHNRPRQHRLNLMPNAPRCL